MSQEINNLNHIALLRDKDFHRLSTYINSNYGIKLPQSKRALLECRLQKRLKANNIANFSDYIDFVFSPEGQAWEMSKMIDAVSTNTTDFFREPVHFEFLTRSGLKEYISKTGKRKLSVWSAGCSSGEEPYTIAMVLKEYANTQQRIDFSITATDISTRMLSEAENGIYNENKVSAIPYTIKKENFQRGKNDFEHQVRIHPSLMKTVNFQKFNLLSPDYSSLGMFDIVFCRNVLIYFEKEIQYRIIKNICQQLNPGGYLFLGHSETTIGFTLPLRTIRPTIFSKTEQ
jgi:chemotaxis protein methyltransferase CheR